MSSVEDINAQIAEYERKIEDLKVQRKIIKFKEFVGEKDLKKMQKEFDLQKREITGNQNQGGRSMPGILA